ncbi:MAG: ATP-dependent DNA ligase [Nitrososphaerota archaeon]|jgi:DNA ligase-1|nr:ATP-dependent DNA ligase [Nitrososphaerota archaeon]MDG6948823.1 ATP-dependent DNA ligase [Nitrososphaerota archaeon]
MLYSLVADCYEKLEATSGRIKTVEALAALLKQTPSDQLGRLVYLTQGKLRPDYEGVELGIAEKLVIRALKASTALPDAQIAKSVVENGDVGSAAEDLLEEGIQQTLFSEPLTLETVYEGLMKIAKTSGEGSLDSKLQTLTSLLNDASPKEAKFIVRTVMGVLRLGVADYTILDAAALAFLGGRGDRPKLEQAYNVYPDLGHLVSTISVSGLAGIESVRISVGVPMRPMLAERLPTSQDIIAKLGGGEVAAEYKLDGERVQIHKKGTSVKLFSRRLEVVTDMYRDAVDLTINNVMADECILEAEVVAMDKETGKYLPFQELMHRRRKHGIDDAMKQYPVSLNFFDVLYSDSTDYTTKPYTERRAALESIVKETDGTIIMPALRSADPDAIDDFMAESLENGGEGLMVKLPSGTYQAGARGYQWVKLKREYAPGVADSMDLVVIGATNGQGSRSGVYGAFLLAVYDKERDVFQSVSKVGTGFSDDDLKSFYEMLQPYKSAGKPANVDSKFIPDVWFKPEVVIEIVPSEITLSPLHTAGWGKVKQDAGLALRFPKFTGKVRDDKQAQDATTVTELIHMQSNQAKKNLV